MANLAEEKSSTAPSDKAEEKPSRCGPRSYLPLLGGLLSGVLLAMCFPNFGYSGLIWFWMLPLIAGVWCARSKKQAFFIAYLSGAVFWLINLKWLWTVSGLGAIALGLFLAIYFGIWGIFASSWGNPWRKSSNDDGDDSSQTVSNIERKMAAKQLSSTNKSAYFKNSLRSIYYAFLNASFWVGLEWLRGWLFTGFSWNTLGVAFHDNLVIAQAADLIGLIGLSFPVVFVACTLVTTIQRMLSEAHRGRFRPHLDFAAGVGLIAVIFCYGTLRIQSIKQLETTPVDVLLVQENTSQEVKWDPAQANNIYNGYVESTENAISQLEEDALKSLAEQTDEDGHGQVSLRSPDLVIWPESAILDWLLFSKQDGYILQHRVDHLLKNQILPLGDFSLISGANQMEVALDGERYHGVENGDSYNAMAVFPSDLSGIQAYQKIHLVIYGEYIPFVNDMPWLAKLFEFSSGQSFGGNFSAGTSTEPLTAESKGEPFQIIPAICFEDTVGRVTRKFFRANQPQLIVNVTNDGWFLESESNQQHLANALFRCIEMRRPMVRSANTGVSAIITTTGSLLDPVSGKRQVIEDESGSPFTRGTLFGTAYLPTSGPATLYALIGDTIVIAMLFIPLVIAGMRQLLKG